MKNKLASFDNDINFPRLWRIGFVLSAVALAMCIGALGVRGLNLGIDFEGGTAWEVVAPDASTSAAREALAGTGAEDAKIQIVGDDVVRVQAEPEGNTDVSDVTERLARLGGVPADEVSVSTVGPTWGQEISEKAQRALIWFFVVVAAYMAVRLEWKMAACALAAVVHDIIITVGVYAIFRFEVTPATVIAVLTILGYSLYDTIVVFDKIHDNAARPGVAGRMTYTDMVSLSLNQVLMRSLNTSITSLLPVLSMLVIGSWVFGAVALEEFSIALAVGLVTGAYSSIFIATPLVAIFKEREPQNQKLRERLDGLARPSPSPSASTSPAPSHRRPELTGRPLPPRPRQKKRRR